MARGRVITPEFWTDEKVIALSPLARLFYIGCWNFAYCDRGHLPNSAFELRLKIFPGDAVNGQEIVDELIEHGKLQQITAGQDTYLQMQSFEKHQTKDKRWKSSRCPACAALFTVEHAEPQPTSMEVPSAQPSASDHSLERRGEEGSREEVLSDADASDPGELLPDDWRPTQQHIDKLNALHLDGQRTLERFTAHARRTNRRQKNWNTAFTNWIRKDAEYAQQQGRAATQPSRQASRTVLTPDEMRRRREEAMSRG